MLALDYYERITQGIEKIKTTQMDAIVKAGAEIAKRLEKGGIFYVFGSGHSHVLAEEVYNRAGGLIQARAILPHELTMDLNMEKGAWMERADGLGGIVLSSNNVRSCDALVVVSNSGRNSVPVQMAEEAKKRGIFTIALTNMTHSKSVTSRVKSGKKLYEVCDIALDNCGPVGDALVPVPGKNYSVAPASTIFGAVVMEFLVCSVIEAMVSNGKDPLLLQSANIDGNDDKNKNAKEQLFKDFPDLREVFTVF